MSSAVFLVLFISAMAVLPMYGVSVFTIGRLVSDSTLPMTLGRCGMPGAPAQTNDPDQQLENTQIDKVSRLRTFQRLESPISDCTDDGGTIITCLGPTNQSFSWDIIESEPSYCWFGEEYCVNGSRTILQSATITTEDLGTTRKSKLAVTYVSECSHIDTNGFASDASLITLNLTNRTWPGQNITTVNESYYAYDLGKADTFPTKNVTNIIWASEAASQSYSLAYWTYPSGNGSFNENGTSELDPHSFLKVQLNDSNSLDNKTGSQSLTLISNRLLGVASVSRNDDPFFLTEREPSLDINTVYMWGKPAGLLACRDQMRLHIRPAGQHPQGYTSSDVVAVGRFEEVSEFFPKYLKLVGVLDPVTARNLETDWNLFAAVSDTPNIRFALDGLSGRALLASESLDMGNQMGFPENITARRELVRWFSTTMLYRLYSAQIFTSGVDNDWGFGIWPIQSLESPVHWVCFSTLRISSTYTSLDIAGLIGIIILSITIITASFTTRPILAFVIRRSSKARFLTLKRALLANRLRRVLQLHRIAVEKTYGHRLADTAGQVLGGGTKAPIYGLKVEELEDGDNGQDEILLAGDGYELAEAGQRPVSRRSTRVLHATMLQSDEENPQNYNIWQLW